LQYGLSFHPRIILFVPCESDQALLLQQRLLKDRFQVPKGFSGECQDSDWGCSDQQQWQGE
jgi:hypothetical protein